MLTLFITEVTNPVSYPRLTSHSKTSSPPPTPTSRGPWLTLPEELKLTSKRESRCGQGDHGDQPCTLVDETRCCIWQVSVEVHFYKLDFLLHYNFYLARALSPLWRICHPGKFSQSIVHAVWKNVPRQLCGVLLDPVEFYPCYMTRFLMMVELAGTPLAPGNYFTESKLGSDAGRQLVQKDRRYVPDWVVRMLISIFGLGLFSFSQAW